MAKRNILTGPLNHCPNLTTGGANIVALVAFALAMSAVAYTQSSSAATLPRDVGAITEIQNALTAMGGAGTWAGVQSAETTGSSLADGSTISQAFTWDDDWSGDTKMKRDNVGEDDNHHYYLQDNSKNQSVPTKLTPDPRFAQMHPPRFDRTTALILHLPAAVLSIALQDSSYGISMATPPALNRVRGQSQVTATHAFPKSTCVRITRPGRSTTAAARTTICFSNTDSLPVYAQVMVPNLLAPSHPLPETVIYSKFRATGNLVVPESVWIINPAGRKKTCTFTSLSLNPTLPSSTFSEVNQ